MMDQLDFDQSDTINFYELDSDGKTSSADGVGAEVSSVQGSLAVIFSLFLYVMYCD